MKWGGERRGKAWMRKGCKEGGRERSGRGSRVKGRRRKKRRQGRKKDDFEEVEKEDRGER